MDDILHAPRDEDAQQAGLPLAKRLERYRAAWMDGMARVRLGAGGSSTSWTRPRQGENGSSHR